MVDILPIDILDDILKISNDLMEGYYLKEEFDITLVYYNPNIYPRREYYKRYNEQKRLIKEMFNDEIKIMNCNYIPLVYYSKVFKNKKDKEGGSRCHICYKLRMEKTAKLAKKYGFDYFTTTLSVSPYKNSDVLNEIGKTLEEKYHVNYLESNFKKSSFEYVLNGFKCTNTLF